MKNESKQTTVITNATISKKVVLEIEQNALSAADFSDIAPLWDKKKKYLMFGFFCELWFMQ